MVSVKDVTREYLSSAAGETLAEELDRHLSAYNSTDDLVPYFGDQRLAHTEAFYQLTNSVTLACLGFYSQAFATLRSVCELSLLQASLPPGEFGSERIYRVIQEVLGPARVAPSPVEVNFVLPAGFGAVQTPEKEASSLSDWAVEGCRTPRWRTMIKQLLTSKFARDFAADTELTERILGAISVLDPYVHARGRAHSATGLSAGNTVQFSEDALTQYAARMMSATQVSISILMVAFLPTATSHPDAAAGFIDCGDFHRAIGVLPSKDAEILCKIFDERDTK